MLPGVVLRGKAPRKPHSTDRPLKPLKTNRTQRNCGIHMKHCMGLPASLLALFLSSNLWAQATVYSYTGLRRPPVGIAPSLRGVLPFRFTIVASSRCAACVRGDVLVARAWAIPAGLPLAGCPPRGLPALRRFVGSFRRRCRDRASAARCGQSFAQLRAAVG